MIDRMQQVYDIIAEHEPITEREIARRAGLKKSPYVRAMIITLMQQGHVTRYEGVTGNRACYLYAINRALADGQS